MFRREVPSSSSRTRYTGSTRPVSRTRGRPRSGPIPRSTTGIACAQSPWDASCRLSEKVQAYTRGTLSQVTTLKPKDAAVSGATLLVWYFTVRPDLADLVQTFIPDWPLWLLVPAALVFSLANAAVEEAAYGGVVLGALATARITAPAVLILQAVAFAALHFRAGVPRGHVGFGLTFVYGLLLGELRRRAGGLAAPFIAHLFACPSSSEAVPHRHTGCHVDRCFRDRHADADSARRGPDAPRDCRRAQSRRIHDATGHALEIPVRRCSARRRIAIGTAGRGSLACHRGLERSWTPRNLHGYPSPVLAPDEDDFLPPRPFVTPAQVGE
jgi:hypothetical protein